MAIALFLIGEGFLLVSIFIGIGIGLEISSLFVVCSAPMLEYLFNTAWC